MSETKEIAGLISMWGAWTPIVIFLGATMSLLLMYLAIKQPPERLWKWCALIGASSITMFMAFALACIQFHVSLQPREEALLLTLILFVSYVVLMLVNMLVPEK